MAKNNKLNLGSAKDIKVAEIGQKINDIPGNGGNIRHCRHKSANK